MGHQKEGNKWNLLPRQKEHVAKAGPTPQLSSSKQNIKQRKTLLELQYLL